MPATTSTLATARTSLSSSTRWITASSMSRQSRLRRTPLLHGHTPVRPPTSTPTARCRYVADSHFPQRSAEYSELYPGLRTHRHRCPAGIQRGSGIDYSDQQPERRRYLHQLQFLVETPVITVTPIGDHNVGDKFTITGTTNLAVGDNVLFTVRSSSFQPTDKTQGAAFAGASGTVQVTQGTSGLNAVSFDVDASTFKPDEYLVTADSVGLPNTNQAVGTALFNVLQASAPTATTTPVGSMTSAAPTVMPTTAMPTTVAPTKTPTQPGFGALVALIGLGAVALLVVRRH